MENAANEEKTRRHKYILNVCHLIFAEYCKMFYFIVLVLLEALKKWMYIYTDICINYSIKESFARVEIRIWAKKNNNNELMLKKENDRW